MDLTNLNKDKNIRRRSSLDLGNMVFGKIPPQAKDIEEVLLGAMMLEPKCIQEIRLILKPDDFYSDAHKIICKAIYGLDDKNIIPDLVLVVNSLRETEELEIVGGPFYISKVTNSVVSSANADNWARIIKQHSLARRLIEVSGNIISYAYEEGEDVFDLLTNAEIELTKLSHEIEESNIRDTKTIAYKAAKKFYDKIGYAKQQLSIPEEDRVDKRTLSFLREWDLVNGEFFPYVYTIAARPGMGKTAFLIEIINKAAQKYPVGFISGEMSDEQICNRIISNSQELNNDVLKKKPENITDEEQSIYYNGLRFFENLMLHIDSDTIDIDKIRNKVKFWVKKYGIRLLVIDFLQILKVSEEKAKYWNETQILNYICHVIRMMSKEFKIPIILLSQLNRELYRRGGSKEPNLADLKGSGTIEEISYQIAFLHRPEYFNQDEPSHKDDTTDAFGENIKNLCYLLIKKHRDGKLGRLKFKFEGQFSKFSEWEDTFVVDASTPWDNNSKASYTQDDLPF